MADSTTPKADTELVPSVSQHHEGPIAMPMFFNLRSSSAFIITTVAIAFFTHGFAYSVIIPILPWTLRTRVGVNPNEVQAWISVFNAALSAVSLITAPIFGFVVDRTVSRRIPLLVGLFGLAGATILLCFGRSIKVLVLARMLQGACSTLIWCAALALVVDTVGGEGIGQALGYVDIGTVSSYFLGPMIGGILFTALNYYAVFGFVIVIIFVDLVLRLLVIEKKDAAIWLITQPDVQKNPSQNQPMAQSGDRSTSIGCDLPSETSRLITDPVDVNRPLVDAKSGASRFQALPEAVLLLGSPRMLTALLGVMISAIMYTSFETIMPLFVQTHFGWSPVATGAVFLPILLPQFLGPIAGYICDTYGSRWIVAGGFFFTCPTVILLRYTATNDVGHKILLCGLLFVNGVALTGIFTPLMAEVSHVVDAREQSKQPGAAATRGAYAQAYSLFNIAWASGSFLGPVLSGLTVQKNGWGAATLMLGCLCGMATVPVLVWTGRRVKIGGRDCEVQPSDLQE